MAIIKTKVSTFLFLFILIKSTYTRPSTRLSTDERPNSKVEALDNNQIQKRHKRNTKSITQCQVKYHVTWDKDRRPANIPSVSCGAPCVAENVEYDIEEKKNNVWIKRRINVPVSCRLPKKCPKILISDYNQNRIPNVIFKAKCQSLGKEVTSIYPIRYKQSDGKYKLVLEKIPIDCACQKSC